MILIPWRFLILSTNSFFRPDGYYKLIAMDRNSRETRRLYALLFMSLLASAMLYGYTLYDMLGENSTEGWITLVAATLLLLNIFHSLWIGRFELNVLFGMICVSLLFTALYWRGFSENLYFIWYLAFPGYAAFAIGLKKARIGMALMLLPILLSAILGHQISWIGDYSIAFESRFIGAYLLMCALALMVQANVEENMRVIQDANKNLESEVARRTKDLDLQVSLLDKEIQERKLIEKQINQALSDKEVLFKEVHHRTKNNMLVIISLLRMQKEKLTLKNVGEVFDSMADRIQSMAMVHEQLYRSEDLDTINFGSYLEQLIHHLKGYVQGEADEVVSEVHSEAVNIDLNIAVPLGMALNEIITNAIKHAAGPDQALKLNCELRVKGQDRLSIRISDNGPGFPEGLDLRKTKSLGLHLIHLLIESQLDGSVNVSSDGGAVFDINVPLSLG